MLARPLSVGTPLFLAVCTALLQAGLITLGARLLAGLLALRQAGSGRQGRGGPGRRGCARARTRTWAGPARAAAAPSGAPATGRAAPARAGPATAAGGIRQRRREVTALVTYELLEDRRHLADLLVYPLDAACQLWVSPRARLDHALGKYLAGIAFAPASARALEIVAAPSGDTVRRGEAVRETGGGAALAALTKDHTVRADVVPCVFLAVLDAKLATAVLRNDAVQRALHSLRVLAVVLRAAHRQHLGDARPARPLLCVLRHAPG